MADTPEDAAREVAEDYADKYVSRAYPEWVHLVSDFLSFRRAALEPLSGALVETNSPSQNCLTLRFESQEAMTSAIRALADSTKEGE